MMLRREKIDGLRRRLGLLCEPMRVEAELHAMESAGQGAWHSLRDDPRMVINKDLPWAGWHMLELCMSHEQHELLVRLWVDYGGGFSDSHAFYLPVKSGRVTKRLLYFPRRPQRLRFGPVGHVGRFSIEAFRMVWLTPWFAHKRLFKRICSAHPNWRGRETDDVRVDLREEAREMKVPFWDLAWQQYDQTFCPQVDYSMWLARQREPGKAAIRERLRGVEGALESSNASDLAEDVPLFSIVMPVFDPQPQWLSECLDSVLAQHFQGWELCIADDASTQPEVHRILRSYAARDARIRVAWRRENGHISAASNTALEMARGRYVALLDHDDRLHPEALLCMAEVFASRPEIALVYSDEDKIRGGERLDPHFKPDWNPDLVLSHNYVCHLAVFERSRLMDVGGFREGYEGSQDHDLLLRFVRGLPPSRIHHVPRVLYHWRVTEGSTAGSSQAKDYAAEAGQRAVASAVKAMLPSARVEPGRVPHSYRVRWPLPDSAPRVSLIIPTRDRVEILRPCLEAILERTDYPDFEVLVVDNESRCPQTLAYFEELRADPRVRVLEWHRRFNYSAINNFAVTQARGDIIGLVNNDIEPINADWLTEMVSHACRPEIGCVGAKLYYPNGRIQHGGVILGLGGVAGHSHKHLPGDAQGYFNRLQLVQNLSAVTAACLLVRREVFDQVGGLDEKNLPVAFNDVDLCLKVREAGYRNLWTPYAEAYHHESASRGEDNTPEKRRRAEREVAYMRRRWGRELDHDPAYNPNLTLAHEDFSLR
ncbi:glycosyltransferase family 2 protein [Ectothiorhodospira shaposhnikovii]|uniref:glycosyltransferase family 2 protein n=1 Tax=Ectothiorhodospira shaposhnikovii TaxID=1054 RepID=UPI001EE82C06|nr:glycosyltransferase family 2 protein [Ectothiorhodospira shaposhnikovii]MCG5513990.1 glycosyltransferase family 2 protein [Ectothiorhodospira shaposhnikovii]